MPRRWLVVLLAIMSLLSACGAVTAVMPRLELGDPLKLDGYLVTHVAPIETVAGDIRRTTYVTRVERVGPISRPWMLAGVEVRGVQVRLGLLPTMTLHTNADDDGSDAPAEHEFPDEFAISRAAARIDARQADREATLALSWPLELRFVRTEACSEHACAYRYEGAASEVRNALSFYLGSDGGALSDLDALMREGGFTEILIDFQLDVQNAAPTDGYRLSFRFVSDGTTVHIGG